ncbi:MAG: hypothetical protein ACTS27_12450 [Phycisphaerales bacterium]
MSSKIKLVIAIVLFVVAIGAIGFYFISGSGGPSDVTTTTEGASDVPETTPTDIFENAQ